MLAQIQKENPQDVRIVYRHLPLIGTPEQPFHDKAALSAQAAEAAGKQGKFWEMHDLLFERQADWVGLTPDQFQTWLVEQAAELGLEKDSFTTDLVAKENVDKVQATWDHGVAIGLQSTPFLLINGQIWPESLPMSGGNIAAIIRLNLLEKDQFSTCPPMTIDPGKEYVATLHTEKGDIKLQLFAGKAPIAVNNFIFLARQGWYNNVTFHRVLPDYIAQAGDPSGTGYGGPGYAFVNEGSDLKFDQPGRVGMANAGEDSNGSQFFITFRPAPNLDGKYTIFGQVIEGMEVAQSLTSRDPSTDLGLPPGDQITSIDIEEK